MVVIMHGSFIRYIMVKKELSSLQDRFGQNKI